MVSFVSWALPIYLHLSFLWERYIYFLDVVFLAAITFNVIIFI